MAEYWEEFYDVQPPAKHRTRTWVNSRYELLNVRPTTQDEIARVIDLSTRHIITSWTQFMMLYDPRIPSGGNNLSRFSNRMRELGFSKIAKRILRPDPNWYLPEDL